jgi:hypothetical protein
MKDWIALLVGRWVGILVGTFLVAVLMYVVDGCFAKAQADMFDTARQMMRLDQGRADTSGVTLRGGAGLSTGQPVGTGTMFRGQATMGSPCGAFDFAASFQQMFEEIPDLLEGLGSQFVAGLPMLALCYASPTACDIMKHVQALSNVVLQSRYASCQATQNAMAYGGLRLRGGAISQCLEDEANKGSALSVALRTCNGQMSGLRLPSGATGPEAHLIQDTLAAAGATTETQTLARTLLGEVTLRANNGQLGSDHSRPQAAMLAQYEAHRQTSDAALRTAVQELRDTGQVSEATLRSVSVPGQAMPQAALDALRQLQQDPVRYESLLGKLSTGLAVTQLTWQCQELQEQLTAATEANTHLTDEEKRLLEKRYDGLRRDLAAVMQKKDVLEKHLQPAIDALLSEYAAVQEVATKAGLRAPSVSTPQMPYRRQQPSGYSQ